MKKEKVVDFVIFTTIIVLIFSLTLLCISIYSYQFDLNDHTLIAGIIAFVGAILGGIISGVLTLKGVKITIEENRRNDLESALPLKLLDLQDIILILERQYELAEKTISGGDSSSTVNVNYRKRVNYIIEYLEDDGLLKKSANVNITTYRDVRRLYNALKKLMYQSSFGTLPYIEIKKAIEVTIKALKEEESRIIETIERN